MLIIIWRSFFSSSRAPVRKSMICFRTTYSWYRIPLIAESSSLNMSGVMSSLNLSSICFRSSLSHSGMPWVCMKAVAKSVLSKVNMSLRFHIQSMYVGSRPVRAPMPKTLNMF